MQDETRAGEWRGWMALAVLTVFQIVDGFDQVTLSLTMTTIRKEWPISDALMGIILASAQLGAFFAALMVRKLSDVVGLRRMLIITAAIMALGSLVTAVATDNSQILLSRVLTGLGLGGAIPLTVGYIARYLRPGVQPISIIIATAGLAVGQMIAGVVAGPIIETFGWRAMFWAAVISGVAIIPSLYLLENDKAAGAVANDRDRDAEVITGSRLRYLWSLDYRRQLIAELLMAFCGAIVFYFLVNWMPVLLEDLGLPQRTAALSATFLSLGGMIGSFVMGPLVGRGNPFYLCGGAFAIAGGLLAVISLPNVPPMLILASCLALGLSLIAAYFSLSVFVTSLFPVRTHVHVLGASTVMTRSGGMLGPIMAGALLAGGYDERYLFMVAAVLLATAGGTTLLIGRSAVRRGLKRPVAT